MSSPNDPKQDLLAAIPKLRAFAASLCGRSARADDLVQETLTRAWAKIDTFEPGTSMIAWLSRETVIVAPPTTTVVPAGTTVVCANGLRPPC